MLFRSNPCGAMLKKVGACVVLHPPSDPLFMTALAILMRAVMIGLAVAAGASLGNMTGRPIRRRLIRMFRRETTEEIKQ